MLPRSYVYSRYQCTENVLRPMCGAVQRHLRITVKKQEKSLALLQVLSRHT